MSQVSTSWDGPETEGAYSGHARVQAVTMEVPATGHLPVNPPNPGSGASDTLARQQAEALVAGRPIDDQVTLPCAPVTGDPYLVADAAMAQKIKDDEQASAPMMGAAYGSIHNAPFRARTFP